MKKIFTLFAALMMVLSMNAETKTIYLKTQQWWHKDGAASAAYYWNPSAAPAWPGVRMTPVTGETDLWSIDLDTDQYQNIIFTRVNGSGAVSDWGAKTQDLTIPTDDKNLFILGTTEVWGDPGASGTWSTYAPDAPKTYKNITITVVANATPKIYWWNAGDKLADANWEARPEMNPTGTENTYAWVLSDVDEVQGVNFIVSVGDVQSADQHTTVDVTKDFKELLPQVSVMGVDGNWNGDKMTIADDYLSASVTLTLDAAKDYDLKLTVNGEWFGSNAITITKDNNSASFAENGDGNGKLTTDVAGDYVFTYTYATKTLEVTYPAPAVVTYMVHAMSTEGGHVEGIGIYEAGQTATLTAVAEEGYQFVNWTINEVEVSTEPTYSFVVTEEVTVVANFKQTAKTVTLSFEVTAQEAVSDFMTTRIISVWDSTHGAVSLEIMNFAEGITEYDLAKVTINEVEYEAVATYSKDEENNKDTYHATAYSNDSLTIYDITFVVATKEIKQYSLYSTTAIVNILEMDMGEGEKAYTYTWTNSAEETDVYELLADSNNPPYYYVGGTINGVSVTGDVNVVAGHDEEGAWLIADAKDYDGNIYHIDLSGPLPKTEEPEVEKPEPTYTENNLNPYAFGLESKMSADNTTLTVTYRLNNSKATEVNVLVYNGEEVVSTIAGTTTIGKNTVDVPTVDLPSGVELTWAVEVKGTSVEAPTQESKQYKFWGPRGLAIDNDPESENFGRILVTESYYGVKDLANYVASGKGSGIYTFNPSFTTDSVVYTGGNDFSYVLGAKTGFQPWRVKISEDGRIFVSSLDLNGVVVWEVSKDLQTWTPVISGAHNADDYRIYDEEGNFVAGPNVSMDVIGSGENLKLLLYSTNNKGIAYNQSGYRLDEYALGTATTWTGTPKNILEGGKFGVVHTDVDFVYDGEGGYWFGGSRGGTAGQPNLVHINAEGVEDFRDETSTYYGGAGVLVQNGMLIKGKLRTSGSVGNFGIYTIGKDAEGKVTLTEKWAVVSNGLGRNHNAFAFDYAGNLYVIGNSGEMIIAYAMPYSGKVETPAASKYAFQLGGSEPTYDVYEDEITNLVFDLEAWPMVCTGGPSANFQVEVYLVLGEDNGDGTHALTEESSISVQGSDATFIEGYLANIDVNAPKADAVIRCNWNGMAIEFHLTMSAAPIEATVVVVENAAIEVEKFEVFEGIYEHSLKMTGVWRNEGIDYPVLAEIPVYYPEATEPYDMMSTVTVGGNGEDDPWLGFGEGYLTITTVGNTITATGVVENPMAGIAIDITISGNLTTTGIENATVTIKSIKKIQNGQLIIEKGGVQYNAQGAIVK